MNVGAAIRSLVIPHNRGPSRGASQACEAPRPLAHNPFGPGWLAGVEQRDSYQSSWTLSSPIDRYSILMEFAAARNHAAVGGRRRSNAQRACPRAPRIGQDYAAAITRG